MVSSGPAAVEGTVAALVEFAPADVASVAARQCFHIGRSRATPPLEHCCCPA